VKAEHCLRLEVNRLAAANIFKGRRTGWCWTNSETGKVESNITLIGGAHELTLAFTTASNKAVEQRVPIQRTACQFGGTRPWFSCPCCGRRVATLFLLGGRFACRQCQRLTYASRSEDVIGRSWRKQGKLERKLGPDWAKPKFMHHATKSRILSGIFACEERRDTAIALFLRRWLTEFA
jgi:hypothetical protein